MHLFLSWRQRSHPGWPWTTSKKMRNCPHVPILKWLLRTRTCQTQECEGISLTTLLSLSSLGTWYCELSPCVMMNENPGNFNAHLASLLWRSTWLISYFGKRSQLPSCNVAPSMYATRSLSKLLQHSILCHVDWQCMAKGLKRSGDCKTGAEERFLCKAPKEFSQTSKIHAISEVCLSKVKSRSVIRHKVLILPNIFQGLATVI